MSKQSSRKEQKNKQNKTKTQKKGNTGEIILKNFLKLMVMNF